MSFLDQDDSLEAAKAFDQKDELKSFRSEFVFPKNQKGENQLYKLQKHH